VADAHPNNSRITANNLSAFRTLKHWCSIPIKLGMLVILSLSLMGSGNLVSESLTPSIENKSSLKSEANSLRAMTLNIYGWKTMPQHADDYARLINAADIDVLAIQEGVHDWQINTDLPTDYGNADALAKALGECWQQRYQIFVNYCRGHRFISNVRFGLSDGPNATRTGEQAHIDTPVGKQVVLNVHWDHESSAVREENMLETTEQALLARGQPFVLLGDFNTQCTDPLVIQLTKRSKSRLLGSAGIDCIIARGLRGQSEAVDASPSDHPALIATLTPD